MSEMETDYAELIDRLIDSQAEANQIGLKFGGQDRIGFQIFEKTFADAARSIATLLAENARLSTKTAELHQRIRVLEEIRDNLRSAVLHEFRRAKLASTGRPDEERSDTEAPLGDNQHDT